MRALNWLRVISPSLSVSTFDITSLIRFSSICLELNKKLEISEIETELEWSTSNP